MKKLWKKGALLLSLTVSLFMAMNLTACGGDDDETPETPTNGGENGGGSGGGTETEKLAAGGNYETLTTERKSVTAPSEAGTITVSGAATYSGNDLKAAWAAAAGATSGDVVISLAKGTYTLADGEKLSYGGAANIKIKGEGTEDYGLDVYIKINPNSKSQGSREAIYMTGAGNLTMENVAVKNVYGDTTGTAQAEVIGTAGTGNFAAYNCSFLSGQDTIRTVGKAWFYKCYIEGDVDFLWIEQGGHVALYEECVLRAINGRTTAAYFTAPRQTITAKVGKGLVIYKSKLEAEELSKGVFLGRNPWAGSSDYYENVAVVDSTYYGALDGKVWYSAAYGTSDQQYIGYKTDDYFAASNAGLGERLKKSVQNAEYAGRRNILNRVYNVTAAKFQKDSDNEWDIDKVISDNGWTVTADSSKTLLDGETEVKVDTYDLTTESLPDTLTITGFSHHSSNSVTGGANATIVVPVKEKAIVYVTGCYSGNGTITAGTQGPGLYDFNTNSTSKFKTKTYVVYAPAETVEIKATSTSYITKIVVEYDSSLSFKPVTKIDVTSADDATEVASKKTLQFTATLTPEEPTNDDIVWSITSGSSVATIDQSGLLTAESAEADTSVTVRATSCDEKAVYGEKTITVKKANASAGELDWVKGWTSSTTVSLAADATYSNSIATGGNISAYYATGETALEASAFKVDAQRNQTGLAYTPSAAYTFVKSDVMITYKFPVTAGTSTIKLTNFAYNWGCGATNNIYGQIKVLGSDGTVLYTGEKLQSGTTANHSSDGIVASDAMSVNLAANATATVVVEITAKSEISNKSNAFVLADAVLDFEKQ